MAIQQIIESELIEWLRSYDGPRFHAVLSDPPYALISITKRFGKDGSAPTHGGSDGRYSRLSSGFMGQKWDGFDSLEHYQSWVAEWSKLLIEKALHPGAVCLFFGGTRTFHHLGVGLERGGFEIVDSVLIPWITGQGFPKSHSYTKATLDLFLQASLQGVARSHYIVEDSEDDYRCLLCDGPLHDALVVVREFEPSQDGAQERIHPSSPSVEIQADNGRIHKVSFGALSFHRAKPDCLPLKTWLTTLRASLESTGTLQREMPQVDKMAALGIPAAVLSRGLNLNESESNNGGGSFLPNIDVFEKIFRKRNNSPLPIAQEDSLISYAYLTRHCETCQKTYLRDFLDWQGRGTHLKPAWEPVFVCRAPRGDRTFAELAIEFGTGALNIDSSRIGATKRIPVSPRSERDGSSGIYGQFGAQDGTESGHDPNTGRWPANFMLTHHEACVKVGEYETKGRVINRWKDGMLPFGGGAGQEYETVDPSRAGEPSADRTYEHVGGTDFAMKPGARRGMETVDLYACVPSCPVRALDDQVGELVGGYRPATKRESSAGYQPKAFGVESRSEGTIMISYSDYGGPSRFFYTAKASRSEKDKGLEDFYWERTDEGFERISLSEYEQLDKRERAHGCIHPTVKPLELLRYLSTLILPPKQEGKTRRILIPFSGSGSEMIGAAQAGWDEIIGVEMESNYIEMAEARLRANIGMF